MKPVLAYRFRVCLQDGGTTMRAQQVTGLGMTISQTQFKTTEGVKKMPSDVKYSNITLKRAVLEAPQSMESPGQSDINTHELINELMVRRINMIIYLLDRDGDYIRSWAVEGAYPVSWAVGDFSADSNQVLIETIAFDFIKIKQLLDFIFNENLAGLSNG